MGLFSRKQRTPKATIVHPDVRREIHLAAHVDAVRAQLTSYSELHSPKHAVAHNLRLAVAEGWIRVELPLALHPWAFHNVAFWLLDTPGVAEDRGQPQLVAAASRSGDRPGYRLVRDPEIPDALCGLDDDGSPLTIGVPTNFVTQGDTVPATAAPHHMDSLSWVEVGSIDVLLEDPGRDLNPGNDVTHPSRDRLRTHGWGASAAI